MAEPMGPDERLIELAETMDPDERLIESVRD